MHASKGGLDDNEKRVGRSMFFDSLDWNETGAAAQGHPNGDATPIKPNKPTNKDNFFSDFATMHEHARPTVRTFSEPESGVSERNTQDTTGMKETVTEPARTAPLIDIGVSFDEEKSAPLKQENTKTSEDLFSNYFDDDFTSLRSGEGNAGISHEDQTPIKESIFNDDFSALKIETNLDAKQNINSGSNLDIMSGLDAKPGHVVNESSKKAQHDSSSFGVLLNIHSTDVPSVDRTVLKSPSTPNFPSSGPEVTLIDTSDPFADYKTPQTPNKKKNKSADDISEKHSEDDFFHAMNDRHVSPSDVGTNNSFSIAGEDVIDPFSVKDDHRSFLDAFSTSSSTSSTPMRHSSSEGDLLGDWGHSHAEPTLIPTSTASSSSSSFHRSASSASDIGKQINQPKSNDPFDFVNFSTGNFAKGNAPNQSSSAGVSFGPGQQQRSTSPYGSSNSFNEPKRPTPSQPGAQQQWPQSMPKKPGQTQSAPNYYVGKAFAGNSVFGNSKRGGLGGSWGKDTILHCGSKL